jgi:hypothetical protein
MGLEVYAIYAGLLYRLRLYHMPVTRNTLYVSSRLSLVHNTGREVSFNVHALTVSQV